MIPTTPLANSHVARGVVYPHSPSRRSVTQQNNNARSKEIFGKQAIPDAARQKEVGGCFSDYGGGMRTVSQTAYQHLSGYLQQLVEIQSKYRNLHRIHAGSWSVTHVSALQIDDWSSNRKIENGFEVRIVFSVLASRQGVRHILVRYHRAYKVYLSKLFSKNSTIAAVP